MMQNELTVYRFEHKRSGLGPFQHAKQRVLGKAIRSSRDCFEDIDHLPEVKKLLEEHKGCIRFSFKHLHDLEKCIIDKKQLSRYSFIIKELKVQPVFVSENGTVLYLENM